MLSTKPIITYTPVSISGYRPSIFMLIDSDKGPEEVMAIDEISQFYKYYGSVNYTDSYNLALKLIKLGYKLYIKRVKLNNSHTSVRLLSENQVADVAYPEINREYSSMRVPQVELRNGIHSFDLTIHPDQINKRLDDHGNILHDYLMIGDSGGWDLIWYDTQSPPVPWNIARRLVRLSSASPTLKSDLIDAIKFKLGYLVTDESISDDIILNISASNEIYQPITSFDSSVNAIRNDDVICSLTDDYKIIDFFSELDDCTEDLTITISRWLSTYRFEITLHNLTDDYPLETELFDVRLDPEAVDYINKINSDSNLVTMVYHGGEPPLGTYTLKRLNKVYATKEDFINAAKATDLTDYSVDFIIDSGFDLSYEITDDERLDYITALDTLRSQTNSQTILLVNYKSDELVNEFSKSFITYFNGNVTEDKLKYPGYLYELELMTHGTCEGYLSSYNVSDIVERDDRDYSGINEFHIDSYNIIEIRNPLMYFNVSYVVPISILATYVMALNKFLEDFNNLSDPTEATVYSCFESSLADVESYMNSVINLEISSLRITDRTMYINFVFEAEYSLKEEFDLIIPIKGIV